MGEDKIDEAIWASKDYIFGARWVMEQMKVMKIKYMGRGVYCILNLWSYMGSAD